MTTAAEIASALRAIAPGKQLMTDEVPLIDQIAAKWDARTVRPAPIRPTGFRQINLAGVKIVKDSEGLRLKAYICPAGKLTIGYGSTGAHVKPNMQITEAQAEDLLRKDLSRFESWVDKNCSPATDNQFSALVSFAFNLGEEALRTSTLRRKHMEGDYTGAKGEFGRWTKARVGGVLKELPGLVKRRSAEAKLYGS